MIPVCFTLFTETLSSLYVLLGGTTAVAFMASTSLHPLSVPAWVELYLMVVHIKLFQYFCPLNQKSFFFHVLLHCNVAFTDSFGQRFRLVPAWSEPRRAITRWGQSPPCIYVLIPPTNYG